MTEEIIFSTSENGIGTILLNRPRALNSLSFEMVIKIREKLTQWATDENVHIVLMKGAGDRAFCAGGDIKSLYEAQNSNAQLQKMDDFFATEYKMDLEVANYKKPIIALLDGIVMGGGMGLSYGATIKVVTDQTVWAMPETTIGFFPDVGASYFLNKAPGFIGRYLALTAEQLNAADALYVNVVTHFISNEKLDSFIQQLEEIDLDNLNIQTLLEKFASTPQAKGELANLQDEIDSHFRHETDSHFRHETVESIIHSLDKSDTPFAHKTKAILLSKSPLSLKVTLKKMIDDTHKSLDECLASDLILTSHFLRHKDFYEGIRSVVIDKDLQPDYQYKTLSSVSKELVDRFFIPK